MMHRIVVCAALPLEVKFLCKKLGLLCPDANDPFVEKILIDNLSLTIAVSGMGRDRMKKRLDSLSDFPVSLWLSVGMAGGLKEDLHEGDCLSGFHVMLSHGEMMASTTNREWNPWFDKSSNGFDANHCLYCSDHPVLNPPEKFDIYKRTQAVAVDMESAAVAEHALRRKEPFAWIKVISDRADEPVRKELSKCFSPQGFPSIKAALWMLMKKPSLLPVFIRMGNRSRSYAKRLAEEILNQIGKFPVAAGENPVAHYEESECNTSKSNPEI